MPGCGTLRCGFGQSGAGMEPEAGRCSGFGHSVAARMEGFSALGLVAC